MSKLEPVGASPLSLFYQGTARSSLEDCVAQLERAAASDFTINLRLYPMSEDITGFLIVKTNHGRIVTNGLGSLHRLGGSVTRVICEVPRFARREVVLSLLLLFGGLSVALFGGVRPLDRVLLIGGALLFAIPIIRREYHRHRYARQMLEFVKTALRVDPTPALPLLP